MRDHKEDNMRVFVLAFVGALGLAGGYQTAGAAPLGTGSNVLTPIPKITLAASPSCPKGQRWIPAGYAKHGKYRAGHCAPK
jgi:hypothetical protein